MSNTAHFDDDMDYSSDDSESDDIRDYGKTSGKRDVRRGIDDYFESKRQRDDDNFLFDE